MARVLIVVDEVAEQIQAVAALKQAIASAPTPESSTVEIRTDAEIAIAPPQSSLAEVDIFCPLTLNLPNWLLSDYPLYRTCRDVSGLRLWVEQTLNIPIGDGSLWLPIVLTAKGALYGEAIGERKANEQENNEIFHPSSVIRHPSSFTSHYRQPIHLSDRLRQPLYRLGQRLLRSLAAPPAVYLLQFGVCTHQIYFDRLFPFPAAPAIASIGIQEPDLYTSHWCCITKQPILDVAICTPDCRGRSL
ncbi:MAG: hypothetical protein HC769_21445 [Cyanobacteria bacterium CRU_2_1]|nr:hypothetical protein [Cyanobacteria bacterium CRU_2_1]